MIAFAKPEFGATCNGCGHCCITNACKMSRTLLHSDKAPCIALEKDADRYWGGLLRNPAKYMEMPEGLAVSILKAYVTLELHIGDGCDDNSPAT